MSAELQAQNGTSEVSTSRSASGAGRGTEAGALRGAGAGAGASSGTVIFPTIGVSVGSSFAFDCLMECVFPYWSFPPLFGHATRSQYVPFAPLKKRALSSLVTSSFILIGFIWFGLVIGYKVHSRNGDFEASESGSGFGSR